MRRLSSETGDGLLLFLELIRSRFIRRSTIGKRGGDEERFSCIWLVVVLVNACTSDQSDEILSCDDTALQPVHQRMMFAGPDDLSSALSGSFEVQFDVDSVLAPDVARQLRESVIVKAVSDGEATFTVGDVGVRSRNPTWTQFQVNVTVTRPDWFYIGVQSLPDGIKTGMRRVDGVGYVIRLHPELRLTPTGVTSCMDDGGNRKEVRLDFNHNIHVRKVSDAVQVTSDIGACFPEVDGDVNVDLPRFFCDSKSTRYTVTARGEVIESYPGTAVQMRTVLGESTFEGTFVEDRCRMLSQSCWAWWSIQ